MADNWSIDSLLHSMQARGNAPAVIALDEGRNTTLGYRDLAEQARRLAAGLTSAGTKTGERVLIIGPNDADWVVVFLAIAAAGLIAMPLDDQSNREEIAAACAASPPDWAFCHPRHREALEAAAPSARMVRLAEETEGEGKGEGAGWRSFLATAETAETPSPSPQPSSDDEAPLLLLQTSGTTGDPKYFALHNRHVAHNVRALVAAGLIGPGDRVLLPLPLHHAYPQVVGLLTPLQAGSTVVLVATVSGPALLAAMRETAPTALIGVPRMYEGLLGALEREVERRGRVPWAIYGGLMAGSLWLRRRFGSGLGGVVFTPLRAQLSRSLRLLVSGGSKLNERLTWRLTGLGFDVRCGYGLAETASITTGNIPGAEQLGSEGKPLGQAEIRIASPDAAGIGEVQIRGPNVFDGYLVAEYNKDTFTEDGWLKTGDLGRLDDDGFLHVTGRIKETLVLGGAKKVNPEELERLYASCPLVGELAVLENDGALVALVRPDESASAAGGLSEIEQTIRVGLAEAGREEPAYRRLAGFALTREALPRTRLGKFRRFLLPERYREAKAGQKRPRGRLRFEDSAYAQNEAATAVWALLHERFGDRLQGLDDHLALDLSIDSLEWIGVELDIQQRTGLDLQGIDLAELATVEDLMRHVIQASAAGPVSYDKAIASWRAPAAGPWRQLGATLRGLNGFVLRRYFSLQVEGLEHLPAEGPFVIVGNHTSYIDGFLVAAALPDDLLRQVRWSAAQEQVPALSRLSELYRGLRIFPVAQGAPGEALAIARAALNSGEILVWFPEGWRSPDGALQRFLPGIGHILKGLDCPVIPTFISGSFEALPRGRRWPRPTTIRLRFGPPLSVQELADEDGGSSTEESIAAALQAHVAALGRVMEAGAEHSKERAAAS